MPQWIKTELPKSIQSKSSPIDNQVSFLAQAGKVNFEIRDNNFIIEHNRVISRTLHRNKVELLGVIHISKLLDTDFFKHATNQASTEISLILNNGHTINPRKNIAPIKNINSVSQIYSDSQSSTAQLITNNNLTLGSLDNYPEIDIVIDGADEIDSNLNLIKGGGGCHVQEKIIASNSKKMIVIADFRKNSDILGEKWKKGVPVEVIPLGYIPIMAKLKKIGGNPVLRMAKSKAGPCVSDNGNFIIDVDFGLIKNPKELNGQIKMIPGIVETGLFINSISADISLAYIGLEDGTVIEKIRDI